MTRINISVPDSLLKKIDEVAKEDYATRSEVIRHAALFYLRSTASTISKQDADALLEAMRGRQLSAYLNKVTRRAVRKNF
jgi:metal-responsive CopG/Arc/MetJ family transcriptional regulator